MFRWGGREEGLGCGVMWREEMNSIPWAVPLVYSYWFTGSTEKREGRWGDEAVCSVLFFIQFFFPQIVSWGRGKWVWGSSFSALVGAWRWFGRRCSSWNREVSWSPPSGFTVCLQAVALAATASSLLHHYVSNETIHRKKNLLPVFFLFTYVKKNGTKFQMDVLCFRNTQGVIKRVFLHMLSLLSNCSRRCGSVHTSSFPTKTISFACVYIDIVGRLLS